MSEYAKTIDKVIQELGKLPGIGARTAERLAFHLLKSGKDEVLALADAVRDLKTRIRPCSICFNPTEDETCRICSNPRRDKSLICVVEQPRDLLSIESTGVFHGVYHVLMGQVSPLDGVDVDDLTIDELKARVQNNEVKEVLLATNPTVTGDSTSLHVAEVLKDTGVRVTHLARGLPVGGQIEYAGKSTLADAINARR